MHLPPPNGIVSVLTDFGGRDPYVGIMKGVIKKVSPRIEILDLCQDVPPQAVDVGVLYLGAVVDRFPVGTVHIAVVDPGVGTDRRAIVACAEGCYWVAPDNGLLSPVLTGDDRVEVRQIDVEALGLKLASNTFHGRDVFAPVAGMLASGRYGFRAVGPRVTDPVRIELPNGPTILAVDHYGNLITGVSAADVARRRVTAVKVGAREIPVRDTYQDAAPGELLALINSYELLEVAVSGGDAAAELGLAKGDRVELVEEAS